jgi:acyl dehydratase
MGTLLQSLQAAVGDTFHSDWIVVDQSMIDRFADATLDHQFIHVEPEVARATPFGGTIAHGFLTLSLLTHLHRDAMSAELKGASLGINYGLDRVRFVHPVRSGSRVRAVSTLAAVEEKKPGTFQLSREVVIEIEGLDKPALVATWLFQVVA